MRTRNEGEKKSTQKLSQPAMSSGSNSTSPEQKSRGLLKPTEEAKVSLLSKLGMSMKSKIKHKS